MAGAPLPHTVCCTSPPESSGTAYANSSFIVAALRVRVGGWLQVAVKEQRWDDVRKHADKVLEVDSGSVKALYRRALSAMHTQVRRGTYTPAGGGGEGIGLLREPYRHHHHHHGRAGAEGGGGEGHACMHGCLWPLGWQWKRRSSVASRAL